MTKYAEIVKKASDLDANRSNFNIKGFRGTAEANCTTDLDTKLTEERWFGGGVFIAQGTHWGDSVTIQVIDKDNVIGYGAGVVLGEYATNFYMITDAEFQIQLEAPYMALIPANVYIRIKYTNTSLIDPVEVALNMVTHIPKA